MTIDSNHETIYYALSKDYLNEKSYFLSLYDISVKLKTIFCFFFSSV